MRHDWLPRAFTLIFCMAGMCMVAQAQENRRISELSNVDRQYMAQQRAIISDIASRNFGSRFNGDKEHDLDLLQRILDQRLVRPEQTRELQAMGVIMGDLLATDLGLHWVVYEDRLGRSRALRYRESNDYLFPVTMISRRQEANNRAQVTDIYQKAHGIMAERIPPLPFE